ncbi:MAG: hypothetical protein ACPGQS_09530 [Bradymonadia bacterium]
MKTNTMYIRIGFAIVASLHAYRLSTGQHASNGPQLIEMMLAALSFYVALRLPTLLSKHSKLPKTSLYLHLLWTTIVFSFSVAFIFDLSSSKDFSGGPYPNQLNMMMIKYAVDIGVFVFISWHLTSRTHHLNSRS